MEKFHATIDQGTSSTKICLFEETCGTLKKKPAFIFQVPTSSLSILHGYVEQCPLHIYETVEQCLRAIPKIPQTISITNQRETVVAWDKITGEPFSNAILWLDQRVQNEATHLDQWVIEKTGLQRSAYFSALKMKWLLHNVKDVKMAKDEHRLMMGTVNSWIIYKLTGKYVTDVTNAHRTMLIDIEKPFEYDKSLLEYFGLDSSHLPVIQPNRAEYGEYSLDDKTKIPITCSIGDQQAAYFGGSDVPKLTIGTGSFFLTDDLTGIEKGFRGLITIARGQSDDIKRCLEIPLAIGGSTMSWFDNTFRSEDKLIEKDSDGIMVFPGLDSHLYPSWSDGPHASIIGLRQDHTSGNIHQAFKECIVFDITSVLKPLGLERLRVDGGLSKDQRFMHLLSDCLQAEILIERGTPEMTAYGAALLGSGLRAEEFDYQIFYPKKNSELEKLYRKWTEIRKTIGVKI